MILLKPWIDTILYFTFLSFSLDKEKILPSKQEKYLSSEKPVPATNPLILAPSLSPTLNKEFFFPKFGLESEMQLTCKYFLNCVYALFFFSFNAFSPQEILGRVCRYFDHCKWNCSWGLAGRGLGCFRIPYCCRTTQGRRTYLTLTVNGIEVKKKLS